MFGSAVNENVNDRLELNIYIISKIMQLKYRFRALPLIGPRAASLAS